MKRESLIDDKKRRLRDHSHFHAGTEKQRTLGNKGSEGDWSVIKYAVYMYIHICSITSECAENALFNKMIKTC